MHTRSTKTLQRTVASYLRTNRGSFQLFALARWWFVFSFWNAVNLGLGSLGVLLK
jgi:hypothetical protein